MSATENTLLKAFKASSQEKDKKEKVEKPTAAKMGGSTGASTTKGGSAGTAASASSAQPPIPYESLGEFMQNETIYNTAYKANFERLVKEKFTSQEYSIYFGPLSESAKKELQNKLFVVIKGSGCEIHIVTTNHDTQHFNALKTNFENCSDQAHGLADKAADENRLQQAEKKYGSAAKTFLQELDAAGDLPDEIEDPKQCLDFLKGTIGQLLAKTYGKSVEDIVATCSLFDQFRIDNKGPAKLK